MIQHFPFKSDYEKQKIAEISVGSVLALIMYAISGHPAYVQLHAHEPPDVIVRMIDKDDISNGLITLLELTNYFQESGKSLLEQLTRTKIAENYDPFGVEYIVGVHVYPGAYVDTEPLRLFLEKNKKQFSVWLVAQAPISPETIELTIVNPITIKRTVNFRTIADEYVQKGYAGNIKTIRVGMKEKARFERTDKTLPPPWEMIGQ